MTAAAVRLRFLASEMLDHPRSRELSRRIRSGFSRHDTVHSPETMLVCTEYAKGCMFIFRVSSTVIVQVALAGAFSF